LIRLQRGHNESTVGIPFTSLLLTIFSECRSLLFSRSFLSVFHLCLKLPKVHMNKTLILNMFNSFFPCLVQTLQGSSNFDYSKNFLPFILDPTYEARLAKERSELQRRQVLTLISKRDNFILLLSLMSLSLSLSFFVLTATNGKCCDVLLDSSSRRGHITFKRQNWLSSL
jgi:hypothetical protein